MNIYALELESSKYYIGKTTRDVSIRFQEHARENGSEWTSMYKPVKVIEQYHSDSSFEEDTLTKKYMMKYGIDNVRGGSYTKIALEEWQIKSLEHEFKSVSDCCYKCGVKGHFANVCPGENFQGTDEELEAKIKDLEAIQHYMTNIKPHQYVSKACIERCLYEGPRNYFYKSIISLICVEACPGCNNKFNIERNSFRTSKKEPEYLFVCENCDICCECVLKNTKVTLLFLENLLRNHCIKNGEISGMATQNLTDNEYKIHIYKTFVNNSKLEKKYNNLVENIGTEKEINKYIDDMLVKLWRQFALRS